MWSIHQRSIHDSPSVNHSILYYTCYTTVSHNYMGTCKHLRVEIHIEISLLTDLVQARFTRHSQSVSRSWQCPQKPRPMVGSIGCFLMLLFKTGCKCNDCSPYAIYIYVYYIYIADMICDVDWDCLAMHPPTGLVCSLRSGWGRYEWWGNLQDHSGPLGSLQAESSMMQHHAAPERTIHTVFFYILFFYGFQKLM